VNTRRTTMMSTVSIRYEKQRPVKPMYANRRFFSMVMFM
jgi:hypothetical protein